jgi:heterodisulfide reductase subunit A-like polyferredoxin
MATIPQSDSEKRGISPPPRTGPVGAVVVAGGGIAGMQASLDLANAGFRVYLVERSTAIGGTMAALDKTFPTNDCAMCIMSPKLVEVGRHPNIEVITNADITALEGHPGNFTVTIRQRPRYVNPHLCTGCGSCAEQCPVEVPSEFEQGLASRKAIHKRYPQAIPNTFAITKRGTAPCRSACPAHVSAQGYIALTKAGRYEEALALVRRDNPFPGVSGLACPRPCERACTRREVDQAVQIRAIKHFLFERERTHKGGPDLPRPHAERKERVAVVGAGPAGLTAAYFLRLEGYQVDVFEAAGEAGGSLRRLSTKVVPEELRHKEVEAIVGLGMTLHLNRPVTGSEVLSKMLTDYHAVLLASGPARGSPGAETSKNGSAAGAGTTQAPEPLSACFREYDPVTLQTDKGTLFVCGELVLGKTSFIHAIGSGKEAAVSIDRFLNRLNLRQGRQKPAGVGRPSPAEMEGLKARALLEPPPPRPERNLSPEDASQEAAQCLECGICCECYQCVEACKAGAVDHDDTERTLEVSAGSVVLAPGFTTAPGAIRPEFGYGLYPNVLTSIEFERLLSASGPTGGHIRRPSDAQEPRRIAWIQCVGSRDTTCNREYCSSICCMYATKEAVIAREHDPRIEPTIFYIDLRAFGKGFDDYVTAAQKTYGVRYVRAMVSKVYERAGSGNLELRYVDEGGVSRSEDFDMVVLSVGVQIDEQARDLARLLRISLDPFGFTHVDTFDPLATSRPGVFSCGVFNGPKDIPETVSEASGAAASAAAELSSSRHTLTQRETFPPERAEASDGEPRIGVLVCHCGINIAATVDVEAVTAHAAKLPGVVFADHILYACSQDSQERLRELIEQYRLNRVVVASCSPRTHEPLFQQTLSQAGLNKYLFDMANIRDQCSWVHRFDKERATAKAIRLTRMAVANVTRARPLRENEITIRSELLVIGGGLAGMTAAREAAQQGFPVFLVEREAELGGNLRHLRKTIDGKDIGPYLDELKREITANPRIHVITGAVIVGHTGYLGNYTTEVMTAGGAVRTIQHGALIVATGGREARPSLYGLGTRTDVLTQSDLERRMADDPRSLEGIRSVAMVQCAGSRDESRPYCSRICCTQAVKNALTLASLRPDVRIDILYRDMRTYGLTELQYLEARRRGVNFVRYDPETNPLGVTLEDSGIGICVTDRSVERRLELRPDLLVLSVGVEAHDNEELATHLKVPRNDYGFFIEAHAKLRPVDFASEGLYLAGLAHYPKSIPETISQAKAAVARAATILSKDSLRLSGVVSYVNPEHCAACLTCVRACPYGVPFINENHKAEIHPALCHGCGICVAECPAHTITLYHFTHDQIMAKIEALTP